MKLNFLRHLILVLLNVAYDFLINTFIIKSKYASKICLVNRHVPKLSIIYYCVRFNKDDCSKYISGNSAGRIFARVLGRPRDLDFRKCEPSGADLGQRPEILDP